MIRRDGREVGAAVVLLPTTVRSAVPHVDALRSGDRVQFARLVRSDRAGEKQDEERDGCLHGAVHQLLLPLVSMRVNEEIDPRSRRNAHVVEYPSSSGK